jgi:benzaldehyde dehydrogenase (NAD)
MATTAAQTTNAGWLAESQWRSRIYLNDWRTGAGGSYAVVEPATGAELGSLGLAGPDDVTLACARAASAGRAWAELVGLGYSSLLVRATAAGTKV